MTERVSGLITNIQDYTVHDGPGLRSLVFLKGCNLRCKWCQNPESINGQPEVMYYEQRCTGCMECVEVCPENAIIKKKNKIKIDRDKCTSCMRCVKVCRKEALKKVGNWMTVDEIMKVLLTP
ncbi:MAG TPA: hypothetical protein DDX29_11140 [Clostridiales bacterium]|nr:hypothetical protein [Clostridiales bacterium]